ncbi:MAG: hypothetical protein HZA20_08915 [Nitrospirae bacterium]|nr:hypothetical protein [Nitrospirota bacterium]
MSDGKDKFILRSKVDSGAVSALNQLVYNRDLGSILFAGAGAGIGYALVFGARKPDFYAAMLPVIVFIPLWLLFRFRILRERVTETVIDMAEGTITITETKAFGTRTVSASAGSVRMIDVEEMPAPDESDIQDIVRWHNIAEPGVHARPLPVYRLVVALNDGTRHSVMSGISVESLLAERERMGRFIGLV